MRRVARPAVFATSTSQENPNGHPYGIPVYRVALVREGTLDYPVTKLENARHAARLLWDYLDGVDREYFVALALDQKNKVIGVHTVSIGTLTASLVHPREFFKVSLLCNAAAVVAGHNHPSGNPDPSSDDRQTTRRLASVGKLLGIPLLDHVVIGARPDYYSFSEQGLLPA
jgi:DNA repair protein RadC